ncbi:hypothetical protein PAECIP112173_02894 [Paenibacillus sp. JJ-100]|uniref:hypothetical protein n=1 Tax=Paenibacillus sp. JJ-100 TaxID=2974896 RepID=UPI0022FF5C36|nr:hypothetical protein [Paenibacillus sp. JJ-100]CAI6080460.1 hypothetical protein PAECIP112173_02894 [Paenibacillus sp. JJ-100]
MNVNNYIGNAAYCYANSAAMLLSSIGEHVEPGLIEVVSGFSLGASLASNELLYFDNVSSSPDYAVTKALNILGFTVKEQAYNPGSCMPIEELKASLRVGPVMVGPLNMGKLGYNPRHRALEGSDHYVLLQHLEGDEVLLHDPAGFPNVYLSLDQLEEAWQYEFPWSAKVYRSWSQPERVERPDRAEIDRRACAWFRSSLMEQNHNQAYAGRTGASAIGQKAEQICSGELNDNEWAHYVYFTLPVGARRAEDYRLYFEKISPALSALKHNQSLQMGACQSRLVSRNWREAGRWMNELADTEAKIEAELMRLMN